MALTAVEVRELLSNRLEDRHRQQRARPLIRIHDKNFEDGRVLWGEIGPTFENKLNETGEGELKLFGDHKEVDYLLTIPEGEDIHLTVDTPGTRWSGKASTIEFFSEDGFEYVTVKFLHEYEHMKKVVCYSNPFFPAEFQWPKIFMYAGPSVTGIKALLFMNLLRRFAPLWGLPENLFDPSDWLANLNPLNWPIVVMPPDDFFGDTSMWTVLTTRFGNFHDVVATTLRDAGLQIVVTRWLPGDPQPAPAWFHLVETTLLVDVVDKSGTRGFSGTPLDGLLSLTSSILSDGITEVVDVGDWAAPPPEYDVPGFFGTKSEFPWVSFRNGQRTGLTGISKWSMTVHKPLAGTVVVGGHSPGWVNAGIKLLLNAALGYLGMLIGNPALAIGIFEDQVTDVVLAFHRVSHAGRQSIMGKCQYGEHWEPSTTGFSMSALQAVRIGMFKTRAYTSFKFEVVNGAPYWIGEHMELGDRIAGEVGRIDRGVGRYYVDQIDGTTLSWTREQDPKHEIALGDSSAEREPGALLSHQLEQVRALISSLGVSS